MDQFSAHLDRGWDLVQKGDTRGAEASARRALELDPNSPEAHNLLGFVAATFGAACETGLSVGYSIAQYFGAQWGKYVRPSEATAFHAILVLATLAATSFLMTAVDPVLVTEVSVVFSAVALPLTYFPILVVANDPDYMGEHVNGRLANGLGSVYLVIIGVAAVAALPLMIWTRMGQ